MGLSSDKFDVSATTTDGTIIKLGETTDYDANADRLVWISETGLADLEMPTL